MRPYNNMFDRSVQPSALICEECDSTTEFIWDDGDDSHRAGWVLNGEWWSAADEVPYTCSRHCLRTALGLYREEGST